MATKNLMVRIGVDMSELAGATDKAKGHFEKLNAVRKGAADNRRDTLTQELEKAQQQLQKLEADYKRMTGSMGQMGTENGLLRQLKETQAARTALDKEWGNKDGSLKDTVPDAVLEQYGVLEQRANELYDKIRQVRLDPASTQEAQALSTKLEEARQKAQSLQDELSKTGQGGGSAIGAKLLDGLSAAGNAARNAFAGLGSLAGRGLQLVGNGARTAAEAVGGLLKNAAQNAVHGFKTMGDGIGRVAGRIGSLAASALVFNVLSAGFRQAQQGIAALVQSDNQLKASLASMRGNLLTAFAPLWQTILPMVRAVAAALAQLAGILARIMAALFGTSVGAAQKSAAAYNKQATAATGAAGATKKAAEEAQKAQREAMDFDVLHKMSDKSSADTSGGGGGGADIPDFTADLNQKSPLVDKLLDAINADDWYKVGALVAEKLNEALADIPWNAIRTQAHRIASDIAETLNGFVETLDWNRVGNALGNGLNVAMDFLDTFVQKFHWESLGQGIGNGLESMRQAVDWETAGRLLTDKFKAIFETLHGFVTSDFDWRGLGDDVARAINAAWNNVDWAQAAADIGQLFRGILQGASNAIQGVDWSQIGQDCAAALKGIDWEGIIADLFELIGSLVGGVIGAGFGFFTELFDGLGDTMHEYFGDVGGMTIEGFYEGIGKMLADVAAWTNGHIVQPFLNGVKNALGIHSPSTVMADIGQFTAQGFLNGIRGGWGSVTSWVSSALDNMVQSFTAWKSQLIQNVGEWASNTGQTVRSWVSETGQNLRSWANTAAQNVQSFGTQAKGKVSEAVSGMRQELSGLAASSAGWGSDFMGNFASAVNARVGSVLASVRNVASSIRGMMHFSVPDRGPLADADTWMPDFMKLLAQGVDGNAPALMDSVQNVARQIDSAYSELTQDKTVMMNRRVTVDTDPLGVLDNGTGDIITALRSGFAQMVRAVEDKDMGVYMDGDRVEEIAARSRRKRARMYGEA